MRWSLPLRECGLKSRHDIPGTGCQLVTPLAGVWIENTLNWEDTSPFAVTPLAGVWIEKVMLPCLCGAGQTSLPLRECGLKKLGHPEHPRTCYVTPLAGVWIENPRLFLYSASITSLPLRECGLKNRHPAAGREMVYVTPLAGVWIENLSWSDRWLLCSVTPLAGVWIEN